MDQLVQFQKARMSRDPRFDGSFFVGVKTTGIFCRPVCKARLPLEKNVCYLTTANQAIEQGFRPCLLCRPDSAPGSFAWKGVETTVERAISILCSELDLSIERVSEKLGVSTRYLNRLFDEHVHISPKRFQLAQRLLFAKQLLHETHLNVETVALCAGFNSAKRLQENMRAQFDLMPTELRRRAQHLDRDNTKNLEKNENMTNLQTVSVFLRYRPPYSWEALRDFFIKRQITSNEIITQTYIAKCLLIDDVKVIFKAEHKAEQYGFEVSFFTEDVKVLKQATLCVRKILDLDADPAVITETLTASGLNENQFDSGLRIPGIVNQFEAACRAVCGQQVSVKAAVGQVNLLQDTLSSKDTNKHIEINNNERPYLALRPFVSAEQVSHNDLSFLKMPQARKTSLNTLARLLHHTPEADYERWLELKGIGPWTVNYVKLRYASVPDIFLETDLIIKQQVKKLVEQKQVLNTQLAAPYRTYLTLNLWNLAS
jgi:AraC family transcriptional regulator of adaptative response / DNA-3-methyladenine glycosylase II